jgi:hypothetical protein
MRNCSRTWCPRIGQRSTPSQCITPSTPPPHERGFDRRRQARRVNESQLGEAAWDSPSAAGQLDSARWSWQRGSGEHDRGGTSAGSPSVFQLNGRAWRRDCFMLASITFIFCGVGAERRGGRVRSDWRDEVASSRRTCAFRALLRTPPFWLLLQNYSRQRGTITYQPGKG